MFIQYRKDTKESEEILKCPNCFALLALIARRAKRTGEFSVHDLEIGEALIGDYKSIGLTEQKYRTAKNKLETWNLATFKATNKGTVAKLANTRVFDINPEQSNDQNNRTITNQQRSNNDQITTNNKVNKEKNVKKQKKDFFGVTVPEFVDSETLKDFEKHRKEIKKPLTETSMKRLINTLTSLKEEGNDINACLNQSIVNGWQGVFADKGNGLKSTKQYNVSWIESELSKCNNAKDRMIKVRHLEQYQDYWLFSKKSLTSQVFIKAWDQLKVPVSALAKKGESVDDVRKVCELKFGGNHV